MVQENKSICSLIIYFLIDVADINHSRPWLELDTKHNKTNTHTHFTLLLLLFYSIQTHTKQQTLKRVATALITTCILKNDKKVLKSLQTTLRDVSQTQTTRKKHSKNQKFCTRQLRRDRV